jgi:tRNA-dihydrouridine synthase B
MNPFQSPFNLGKLKLSSNIFYAPLAGCSDLPFRRMSAKYNPGLIYCEMVKMDALVRKNPTTLRLLDFLPSMHPIGAQLCGSKLPLVKESARIIEDLGFDVIDLNCGCPVDKVTKDGSGSGLLKNPLLIGEIVAEMVATVKIPVTVKIRAGWDENSINAVEITKIAEEAGAEAICIHGRTRVQAYKGPANWGYIKMCKEAATRIKVIGNGDVFTAEKAKEMFEYTGCDAVLISRGTLGQPWIVEEITQLLTRGTPPRKRDYEECRQALLEHFQYSIEYKSEKGALIDMRRVGCWYFKKAAGTREFRGAISHAQSIEEVRELIENFTWRELTPSEEEEAVTCDEC